jgi:hypothetical protein
VPGILNLTTDLTDSTDGRRTATEEDLTTKNAKNTKKEAQKGIFAGFRAFCG